MRYSTMFSPGVRCAISAGKYSFSKTNFLITTSNLEPTIRKK